MPDDYMPSWLSYTLSATGLASAAGAVMLYLYQSDLLYLPSHPEGSRTEVRRDGSPGPQSNAKQV